MANTQTLRTSRADDDAAAWMVPAVPSSGCEPFGAMAVTGQVGDE